MTISSYFGELGLYWRRRETVPTQPGEEPRRLNTWEVPESDLLELIAQNERLMNRVAELRLLVKQRDPVVRKVQRGYFPEDY